MPKVSFQRTLLLVNLWLNNFFIQDIFRIFRLSNKFKGYVNMDKIIYERVNSSIEPQKIVFEVSPDLSIKDFKLNCIRMAQALGYNHNSIKKEFNHIGESGDASQLKLLFG